MKTGFSLWELTYREFPVSLTGFGFAVQGKIVGYRFELTEFDVSNLAAMVVEQKKF